MCSAEPEESTNLDDLSSFGETSWVNLVKAFEATNIFSLAYFLAAIVLTKEIYNITTLSLVQ
jgi:hypothetical protein